MKVFENKKITLLVVLFASTVTAYKVIYAVNLGGEAATDSNGINYQKDNSTNAYTASCPENMTISGISKEDEIIYRRVRHKNEYFEIAAIPDKLDNGEYLINFKIVECWTKSVRPINITINKHHTFTVKVPGTADQGLTSDKYYYFNICDKRLHLEETSSPYTDGPLIIDLGPEENGVSAVVSAIVLIKLSGNPVPKSLWPTKDEDLAKISKPFACRTIDEVYIEMHQQHKELSSNITTKLEAKFTDIVTQQSEILSKISTIEQGQSTTFLQQEQIQKKQEDLSSILSSNISNQVETQTGILMANQNKLEAKIADIVQQQDVQLKESQSELLSKISTNDRNLSATYFQQSVEIQQIQKNQEKISSKLVTIFDILNDIQVKFNKPEKKTIDIIDDSEL
jgi:hypothetical protein